MGVAQIDISLKNLLLSPIELCLLCQLVERQLLKSTPLKNSIHSTPVLFCHCIPFVSQSNGKSSNRHLAQNSLCLFMKSMASIAKSDVAQAIASVYQTEWGRIVAILIRLVGDFDLAEEAALSFQLQRWHND